MAAESRSNLVSAKRVWDAVRALGNCSSFTEVKAGPTFGLQERGQAQLQGQQDLKGAGCSMAGNTWMDSELPSYNPDLLRPCQTLEQGNLENQ